MKSTTETVGVGTRRLKPSNLPLRSGITRARAFAAPVDVGMMFWPAARARRGSLWATSRMRWSLVYEWIVFIRPRRIVNRSWTTLAAGARQFVVQLALLMIWCWSGSYFPSLTPRTIVMSSPLAGALMMTFFAPASMWARALSASVKMPVDSITMSTPRSPHGSWLGSLTCRTLTALPSITTASSVWVTSPG